jgi:hypothetical protein
VSASFRFGFRGAGRFLQLEEAWLGFGDELAVRRSVFRTTRANTASTAPAHQRATEASLRQRIRPLLDRTNPWRKRQPRTRLWRAL